MTFADIAHAHARRLGVTSIALVAGLALAGAAGAATTYTYTGPTYDSVNPFGMGCVGACFNYTTSNRITGSFTVSGLLSPNLAFAEIRGAVTSFSFTDGINTYSSADVSVRAPEFQVSTNGAGQVTSADIIIQKWLDGLAGPHTTSSRIASIDIDSTSTAYNNAGCDTVGPGQNSVADSCTSINFMDNNRSIATNSTAGSWGPPPPTNVPTLGEWALVLFGGLTAAFGALVLWARRRITPLA